MGSILHMLPGQPSIRPPPLLLQLQWPPLQMAAWCSLWRRCQPGSHKGRRAQAHSGRPLRPLAAAAATAAAAAAALRALRLAGLAAAAHSMP